MMYSISVPHGRICTALQPTQPRHAPLYHVYPPKHPVDCTSVPQVTYARDSLDLMAEAVLRSSPPDLFMPPAAAVVAGGGREDGTAAGLMRGASFAGQELRAAQLAAVASVLFRVRAQH